MINVTSHPDLPVRRSPPSRPSSRSQRPLAVRWLLVVFAALALVLLPMGAVLGTEGQVDLTSDTTAPAAEPTDPAEPSPSPEPPGSPEPSATPPPADGGTGDGTSDGTVTGEDGVVSEPAPSEEPPVTPEDPAPSASPEATPTPAPDATTTPIPPDGSGTGDTGGTTGSPSSGGDVTSGDGAGGDEPAAGIPPVDAGVQPIDEAAGTSDPGTAPTDQTDGAGPTTPANEPLTAGGTVSSAAGAPGAFGALTPTRQLPSGVKHVNDSALLGDAHRTATGSPQAVRLSSAVSDLPVLPQIAESVLTVVAWTPPRLPEFIDEPNELAVIVTVGASAAGGATLVASQPGGWAAGAIFNLWLRRQLREKRITQRQLAERSGVDHSAISRLVRGQRAPGLETATKLAKALREIGGDDEVPVYFETAAQREVDPIARVEYALRGDDVLDDAAVRELMLAYLVVRRRRQERHVPASTAAPPSAPFPRHRPEPARSRAPMRGRRQEVLVET